MDWTMGSFSEEACARIRKQVGDQKVVLGLSGGVDSSVTAALLHKAIGDQLTCIFVNNGLLRSREEEIVQRVFGENFHVRLKYVDASKRFLALLKGVTDPETKRKRIGNEFIKVFQHGLPKEIVYRQPFPGPGLAVRILGEVTPERLSILREADTIVVSEMESSGWYYRVWQSFAVLLPVRSVGVMGDQRTYENTIVLRIVESQDGMTADWVRLPYELLARISARISNEVKGVNRVCYDISSKPPSTIEWE